MPFHAILLESQIGCFSTTALTKIFSRPVRETILDSEKGNSLAFDSQYAHRFSMATQNPMTLSPQQIEELNQKLAKMRHDINNHLSLVVFAVEVLRSKPEMMERMMATLSDQPPKIMADLVKFSAEFEQTFGIVRD
jgi:hypothetical protein